LSAHHKVGTALLGRQSSSYSHALLSLLTISCRPLAERRSCWFVFRWHLTALLVVTLFFGAIRWRLLDMPLERDEGEYAYAGQLILEGIPPYKLAYNMKLPGTYLVYTGILAAFGETIRGIHLGLLFVNMVSIVLLCIVTVRVLGMLAGTIAGASYALLSANPTVLGFQAHATHFVVLAELIGLILLLRAEERGQVAFFFWSGLAFGLAFLMKQPGILLGTFAFLYLAFQCWPKNKHEWAPWAKNMCVFLLAGVLPFAVTCCLLYRAGVFQTFWFWTFTYARQYATIMPLGAGLGELANHFSKLVRFAPWLWAVALIGVSTGYCDPIVRRRSAFVFGLLVFSFAAVCPGLYFRPPSVPCSTVYCTTDTCSSAAHEVGEPNWTRRNIKAITCSASGAELLTPTNVRASVMLSCKA
jgi:hypothetical protein